MFIKPKIETFVKRSFDGRNNPVNLSKVEYIYKTVSSQNEDPTISFVGINTTWIYEKASDRDAAWDRILDTMLEC